MNQLAKGKFPFTVNTQMFTFLLYTDMLILTTDSLTWLSASVCWAYLDIHIFFFTMKFGVRE